MGDEAIPCHPPFYADRLAHRLRRPADADTTSVGGCEVLPVIDHLCPWCIEPCNCGEPMDCSHCRDVDDADDLELDDDCVHVGYHEEAGGFLVCDECGEDVTIEIERTARLVRSAFQVPDPLGDEQDKDPERDFDWIDDTIETHRLPE